MATTIQDVGNALKLLDGIVADLRDESINTDNEQHWADWCRFWKEQLMHAMGTLTDIFTSMRDGVVYGQTTGE